MPATLFIGDVHGKYKPYKRILRGVTNTIQVGDMGVGFRRTSGPRQGEEFSNPPHAKMLAGNHRFIRGNHDNPQECCRHSQYIPDGTVEGSTMFIGGAKSVDRAWRTEGFDWWADEELSYDELQALMDKFIAVRPQTMVTHDCPEEVAKVMEAHACRGKIDDRSITRDALQAMWSAHSPRTWVFGHWHFSFDHVLRGTRFVCLAELECKEIEHE